MKHVILTLLCSLILTACASGRHHKLYEGDVANMARLESFDTVLIKYIDDEDMGVSFIGQQQQYDIKAGQHTLLVEYSDIFDVDSENHEKIVSRPAKITFVAEAGKRYQIQHPPQQRLNHAKAFAEKPEFSVLELPALTAVPATVELSRPRSFLPKLKFSDAPTYEFASDAVTPAAAGAAVAAGVSAAAHTPAPPSSGDTTSPHLHMLQYSWKNASQAERKAFLQWIGQ